MPKTVNPEGMALGQKIIDQIGYSNAALDKAAAAMAAHDRINEKVAELIPVCVEALIANQRIDAVEKQAAEKVLRDPVQVLELLTKIAGHRNAAEQARLGQPTGQVKQASSSLTSSYVGGHTSRIKESDRRLFEGLGLPVPQ